MDKIKMINCDIPSSESTEEPASASTLSSVEEEPLSNPLHDLEQGISSTIQEGQQSLQSGLRDGQQVVQSGLRDGQQVVQSGLRDGQKYTQVLDRELNDLIRGSTPKHSFIEIPPLPNMMSGQLMSPIAGFTN